jgi:hypothetical protein
LSQQPGFHTSSGQIESRTTLIAARQASGAEDNANALFLAPSDAATLSEVICGDYEIEYRGNTNLALNLKGGAGLRNVSNETIDSRTVECD